MKHEAKWIVRAREAVTRGIIEPRLIPRHENLADPGTATRGPTDFIPMRDAMLSSHQDALTTQEIAHREVYPHVREARANIASRRRAANTTAADAGQQHHTPLQQDAWKFRPDTTAHVPATSHKSRWAIPDILTPTSTEFHPARDILLNQHTGSASSSKADSAIRPTSAAHTAVQQATREHAQQPAGL